MEIAGYRLQGLIGAGAAGEVHRALAPDGSEVALKLLPLADADTEQRFGAEIAAAGRLQHPGIVRVLAAGADHGRGWIAMELLAGTSLDHHTRASRLLPLPQVLEIAERVARALAHAHEQGIVHRDVKPANVIVELAGGTDGADGTLGRVSLTDFGIAHLADAERTRTGVVLGSPAYMAPEQLAGAPASAAGDLYALGVMLFELLAGRRPHDAGDTPAALGELLRRVAREPAPDLRTLRPELPADLAELVAALLAKQPARRGAGAAALADRLHALRAAPGDAGTGGPKSRA